MIIVITGQPGNGKTLFTISHVEQKRQEENRPVYYHGINDLKLSWQHLEDPHVWYELPPNSIVVIDECFKIWPPRKQGAAVPKSVEELATHRHLGIDLYVIVQHPQLLDIAVRKLAGRHYHVVRTFGQEKAKLYQWERCVDPQDRAVKNEAIVTTWNYPKSVYDWYKSAELHTVRKELPWRVILKLVGIVFAICLLIWYAYGKLMTNYGTDSEAVIEPAAVPQDDQPLIAPRFRQNAEITPTDPTAYQPTVLGMPWTAPAYQPHVKIQEVPVLAGCLSIRGLETGPYCKCADQQGNNIPLPLDMCFSIVENGMFDGTGLARSTKRQNVASMEKASREFASTQDWNP